MANTWTWFRARDSNGTLAAIVTELASPEDIEDFNERYGGSFEVYRRPEGYHWDGGAMAPSEVRNLIDRPYVRY